jgi:hypothetical protein
VTSSDERQRRGRDDTADSVDGWLRYGRHVTSKSIKLFTGCDVDDVSVIHFLRTVYLSCDTTKATSSALPIPMRRRSDVVGMTLTANVLATPWSRLLSHI